MEVRIVTLPGTLGVVHINCDDPLPLSETEIRQSFRLSSSGPAFVVSSLISSSPKWLIVQLDSARTGSPRNPDPGRDGRVVEEGSVSRSFSRGF